MKKGCLLFLPFIAMASLTGCKSKDAASGKGPFSSILDMSVDAILDLEFESDLGMPDNNDYAKLLIAATRFTEDHNSLQFGGGYEQNTNDGSMRYMYSYGMTHQKNYLRVEEQYSYKYPNGLEYRDNHYFEEIGFKKGVVYDHGRYYSDDDEYDTTTGVEEEDFESAMQSEWSSFCRYMSYTVDEIVQSTVNTASFKYGKISDGYYAFLYYGKNVIMDTNTYQYHGEYYDGNTFQNYANIVICDKKSDGSYKLLAGFSGYEVYVDYSNGMPLEEPMLLDFECQAFLGKTDNTDYLSKLVSSMPKTLVYISFYFTAYEFLYNDSQDPEKPTALMPTNNPSYLNVTSIGEYRFITLPTVYKDLVFTISYVITEYKLIDNVYVETEEPYEGYISKLDFPFNIELETGELQLGDAQEEDAPVPYFVYHDSSSLQALSFQYQYKKSGNNYKVDLVNPVFLNMY